MCIAYTCVQWTENSELTKTSVYIILRHSCISIKGHFAELAVIPNCVVFTVITNTISFSFIVSAAICMTVTLACCNIQDKQNMKVNHCWRKLEVIFLWYTNDITVGMANNWLGTWSGQLSIRFPNLISFVVFAAVYSLIQVWNIMQFLATFVHV